MGKLLIILIFISFSNFCYAQKTEYYIKSDTTFQAFRGKIAGKYIYMFLQFVNDSAVIGHYQYYNYGIDIPLIGKIKKDSLLISELDSNKNKTALLNFKMSKDSLTGSWSDMKKIFHVKLIKSYTTGDVYEKNTKSNALIFVYQKQSYNLPISKYLDTQYNYTFVVLFNEIVNDNFYALVTFINYPGLQKKISNKGEDKSEQVLLYSKFNKNGTIDTVQLVNVQSTEKGILTRLSYSIYYPFKNSLNINVYHFMDNYKLNVSFNKSKVEDGLTITKEPFNFPIFRYDTLNLAVDDGYDLIRRYRIKDIDNQLNYTYQVDSVYEKNNKDLDKISLFCESLKGQTLDSINITPGSHNENISIEDDNFDGINDIFINTTYPNAPVNDISQEVWLFNVNTNRYEKSKELSGMPIWGIDRKNKTIATGYRMGGSEYYNATYQFINGKLTAIETVRSTVDKKGLQTIVTKKLVNGKWIVATEKQ